MKNYTRGNATVTIQQDMQDMFMGFIHTVAPNAGKIMEEELQRIEKQAVRDWPKRKPQIRTDAEGNVVFFRKTSKESWKKFERGMKVDANGNFIVFLKNTAPYSYVIKYGVDSENYQSQDIVQPQGRRVADETMVKPHRKTANRVVKALADDLMKRV
jgi:hypothetical protein